jgi:hypothetical protein
MKKRTYILLFCVVFLITGCSQIMFVLVRFKNIDSSETKLQLHFEFVRMINDEKKSLDRIWIYRNDSLVLQLENQDYLNDSLYTWEFPSIPDGFKIAFPDSTMTFPSFSKKDNLRFEFLADGAYGSWLYKPNYSIQEFRWLFDHEGKQKINIGCHYERWLGKDIISIESTEDFVINDSTFYVSSTDNQSIDFEIKYKRNPTKKVALVLDKKYKKGTLLNVTFQANDGKIYKETIKVPDKSDIGIAGKYGDL